MRVVEREKGLSQGRVPQHIGRINRSWLCIIHRSGPPLESMHLGIESRARLEKQKNTRADPEDRSRVLMNSRCGLISPQVSDCRADAAARAASATAARAASVHADGLKLVAP